jgi:decaprenyl-phosphate phosphoribosyltransferase
VLVRACRPRQWSKNLLVLAAPAAAGVLDRGVVLAQLAGAFVALCAISSATYLVNDVRDREDDRLHPQKRYRPIAAGELSVRAALLSAVALAAFGLSLATAINWKLGALGVGYLALTASYSLWWRSIAVLDILVIAAGFVLRAFAGGAATDIYLSRYFVIVTACCAVFLVAAKRYAEQRERAIRPAVRATLAKYSPAQLRWTLVLAAVAASVTYATWALTRPANIAWYVGSTVPFVLWLARYAALVAGGVGEAPEELILRDRLLLSLTGVWALLFLAGVYVGR